MYLNWMQVPPDSKGLAPVTTHHGLPAVRKSRVRGVDAGRLLDEEPEWGLLGPLMAPCISRHLLVSSLLD